MFLSLLLVSTLSRANSTGNIFPDGRDIRVPGDRLLSTLSRESRLLLRAETPSHVVASLLGDDSEPARGLGRARPITVCSPIYHAYIHL
jgi:hypothetical protein